MIEMEIDSSGISKGHTLVMEAEINKGETVQTVNGDGFSNGYAVVSYTPNEVIFQKSFKKRELDGYYCLRDFHDVTDDSTISGTFTSIATLEIYEDGVLKVWTTGNSSDGKIPITYWDEYDIVRGERIYLWFDPSKSYEIKIRTALDIDGTYGVILDYLQLEQIHSGNPIMNIVEYDGSTGINMSIEEVGITSMTGNNTSSVTGTIVPWIPFKSILYADVQVESNSGLYNANTYNFSGLSFDFSIQRVDSMVISSATTLTIRYFCKGVADFPIVRGL